MLRSWPSPVRPRRACRRTAAQPDVVTVDARLPDGDGLRLARESRDREADLGMVLLTVQEEDDVLFRALEGVSAFVAKSAAGNILIAARAASRG